MDTYDKELIQIEILTEDWIIFAAVAWMGYQLHGRGVVILELDEDETSELSEKGEDIAKRHGADKVLLPNYPIEVFARFIAKMAYGYAVERYTLDGFEEVYVVPAILGKTNDIGRWVGCSDRREFPVRDCTVSVGFKIISKDELIVKIKMFPQFDGAEYVIVIGRVKEIYKNYYHSLGQKG